jgi:hypothetical protein
MPLSIIIQIHPKFSRISPESTFLMTKQINFSLAYPFPYFFLHIGMSIIYFIILFFSLKWEWIEWNRKGINDNNKKTSTDTNTHMIM